MNRTVVGVILALGLPASQAFAQSTSGSWSDVPDRFQVDAGFFRIRANTVLRFDGPANSGDVDFEQDLGLEQNADTFWVDGTWRVGRRHQLKLAFTRLSRERDGFTLQRDFVWGGEQYSAGLTSSTESSSNILAGYYRFALVRNDRFEIGPTVGIGHLTIRGRVVATGTVGGQSQTLDRSASTGSVTGAVGGYTSAWLTKRLLLSGDFLYIKVNPGESEASVTDWRVGANYYFHHNVGLGVQYKYDRFQYDRGILVATLGGEVTYEGGQAFVTFRF